MAMSTMDNASAQLAIALQLQDLNELEARGAVDKLVIRLQRQQFEVDSGFDAITFEASRRIALSIAKAVEDDSALLARSTRLPQIDNATFNRLALLNRSSPTSSNAIEPAPQPKSTEPKGLSKVEANKRASPPTSDGELSSASVHSKAEESNRHAHTAIIHKGKPQEKEIAEQNITVRKFKNSVENKNASSIPASQSSTAGASSAQTLKETASETLIEALSSTADCASCGDRLDTDKLVKAACEHHYCKDCFSQFIEASLQPHDGFPPKCCKIPIPFLTVAGNVSAAIYSRYSARQAEVKNATALYCGVQRCGVKIETDRVKGVRATCVACWRDTCTKCRDEFPEKVDGRNIGHACKKDKAREQVLEIAKEEGWQACYHCGNLVELNFGCHHMRCRCKAEFCYRCGTKWRNCECGNYDEPRLEARAARAMGIRAARRVAQGLPPDPRPREQQLAELQQRLQVDCDHNYFAYENRTPVAPGRCELCEYRGWKYILRCDGCQFTACRWCHNFFGWHGGDESDYESDFYGDDDRDN